MWSAPKFRVGTIIIFLLYINDIYKAVRDNAVIFFAVDTSVLSINNDENKKL